MFCDEMSKIPFKNILPESVNTYIASVLRIWGSSELYVSLLPSFSQYLSMFLSTIICEVTVCIYAILAWNYIRAIYT